MKRIATIFFALCFFAQPLLSKRAADPALLAFSRLEIESRQFERDKKAQKFRHNYEKIASKWESFSRKYAKSPKAALALVKAADLYEKVADITHFTRDYKKTAETLLLAMEKTVVRADRDAILVRAARIFETQMGDSEAAIRALEVHAKPVKMKQSQKRKTKQNSLPQSEALYAELMAKTRNVSKKRELLVEPIKAKQEALKLERIEKVELLNSDKGVGLRLAATGELFIKHGVIPKNADSPRRVFFDFSRSQLDPSIPLSFDISKEGVRQVRLGQFKEDVVRIVVEAEASIPFHVKADDGPIEIWFGQTPQLVAEEAPAETIPEQNEAPLGLALRRIVIDPGHGGSDPGAIGRGGLKEKDVTLAISKRLKAELEQQMPGIRVFLTRDSDKFISLSERTQFANELHADLFVSVHVNSSPNRKTQGIETYYLNITHDRYAVRLAARENAMSETEISNLEFILADLAMKSNVSDSVRLGREVQSSVFGHVQGTWSDVKDLGLKHALFYVLLGARMPAVLVETAFISNHEDEKRLRTDRYQDAIVAGLVKGIRRYSEQKQAMYQP